MDNFLLALCDSDINGLVISGEVPQEELQSAWVVILEEYYDLKGTEGGSELILNRDVIRLQNHLTLVETCVNFLRGRYSDKVAESLRLLGYTFRPLGQDPNEYSPLLDAAINKSKTKYVTLQQLNKQLEERMAEIKEFKPPSREYFENLIVYIEEMQGTAYNLETLTVAKFVTLEKKYWKHVDFLKEKN